METAQACLVGFASVCICMGALTCQLACADAQVTPAALMNYMLRLQDKLSVALLLLLLTAGGQWAAARTLLTTFGERNKVPSVSRMQLLSLPALSIAQHLHSRLTDFAS